MASEPDLDPDHVSDSDNWFEEWTEQMRQFEEDLREYDKRLAGNSMVDLDVWHSRTGVIRGNQ